MKTCVHYSLGLRGPWLFLRQAVLGGKIHMVLILQACKYKVMQTYASVSEEVRQRAAESDSQQEEPMRPL